MEKKAYELKYPILDKKEIRTLDKLNEEYKKITEPSAIAKAGKKVGELIPVEVKKVGNSIKLSITEQKVFIAAMENIAKAFNIMEQYVAKYTLSEKAIIKRVNSLSGYDNVESLEEFCLIRTYDLTKLLEKGNIGKYIAVLVEGGGTGALGAAGIPFNLAISTLLYFRTVQSVAMFYGYDIKGDPAELAMAAGVFTRALNPGGTAESELGATISKFMAMTTSTTVKQTAKKTWTDMASKGGVSLFITQMRALAHKSAQKALEKAGKEGLEKSIFKEVFEQIGKRLTLKAVQRSVPIISGVIGAAFDTVLLNKVISYSSIFYQMRFIQEKEMRIGELLESNEEVITVG